MAWLKARRVNEGAAWEFEELQCMHFIDPIDVPCSFIIFYCYEKIEWQCFLNHIISYLKLCWILYFYVAFDISITIYIFGINVVAFCT